MNRTEQMRQMIEDKKKLTTAGWEYVLSLSYVPGESYGLLFMKNGEKFWLNKETREKLPVG